VKTWLAGRNRRTRTGWTGLGYVGGEGRAPPPCTAFGQRGSEGFSAQPQCQLPTFNHGAAVYCCHIAAALDWSSRASPVCPPWMKHCASPSPRGGVQRGSLLGPRCCRRCRCLRPGVIPRHLPSSAAGLESPCPSKRNGRLLSWCNNGHCPSPRTQSTWSSLPFTKPTDQHCRQGSSELQVLPKSRRWDRCLCHMHTQAQTSM
jgi:hypothetical protein